MATPDNAIPLTIFCILLLLWLRSFRSSSWLSSFKTLFLKAHKKPVRNLDVARSREHVHQTDNTRWYVESHHSPQEASLTKDALSVWSTREASDFVKKWHGNLDKAFESIRLNAHHCRAAIRLAKLPGETKQEWTDLVFTCPKLTYLPTLVLMSRLLGDSTPPGTCCSTMTGLRFSFVSTISLSDKNWLHFGPCRNELKLRKALSPEPRTFSSS